MWEPAVVGASAVSRVILRPELALLGLELSRISGVVAISPIPWSNTPRQVKVGLVIFLLAVVHGTGTPPEMQVESATWAASRASSELIVGLAIGTVVRLSIAAAEIAGSAIAMPMGFSAAQAFDPTIGATDTVLTRIFRQLALLLAVLVGLHRVMLGTLIKSFVVLPVGTVVHVEATFPLFLELSGHVLSVGVQLALPLLSILLMANVALGFVARAAPTMQIFNIGFAVLLVTGAAVLLITLPDLSREIVAGYDRNVWYLERLLVELSGH
jgi:flagellar biosynthetic protein FliR